MANCHEICAPFLNPARQNEGDTSNNDRLFGVVETLKASLKIRKFVVSENEEVSLSSLYRFDAVILQTVDTFAKCLESCNNHARSIAVALRFLSETNVDTGQKRYSRGGTIFSIFRV